MQKQIRLVELSILPALPAQDVDGNHVIIPRRVSAAYVVDILDGEAVFATSAPHRLVADYPPGDEAALAREYVIDGSRPPTMRSLNDILDDAGIAPARR